VGIFKGFTEVYFMLSWNEIIIKLTLTAPAMIHKMGHCGMVVTNFEKAYKFYTTHFNFKASDVSESNSILESVFRLKDC
jgi:catechol-2,3-dioxygenase